MQSIHLGCVCEYPLLFENYQWHVHIHSLDLQIHWNTCPHIWFFSKFVNYYLLSLNCIDQWMIHKGQWSIPVPVPVISFCFFLWIFIGTFIGNIELFFFIFWKTVLILGAHVPLKDIRLCICNLNITMNDPGRFYLFLLYVFFLNKYLFKIDYQTITTHMSMITLNGHFKTNLERILWKGLMCKEYIYYDGVFKWPKKRVWTMKRGLLN